MRVQRQLVDPFQDGKESWVSKRMSDAEYFASEEFKRRAEAQARQSFNVTPLAESERIYRSYLKNQMTNSGGNQLAKTVRTIHGDNVGDDGL